MRSITVIIVRRNPETKMKPTKVSYVVPYGDRMRVLDALNFIRENYDSTLAFRFSCRFYAKCGTCAAMVDGKPVLTCYEPAHDQMLIEPLANLPVIRDLVVERTDLDKKIDQQVLGDKTRHEIAERPIA